MATLIYLFGTKTLTLDNNMVQTFLCESPLLPKKVIIKHCHFTYMDVSSSFKCEEAIQLACGMLVVLPRCLFVPEMMHRRAPEVFLHQ
jgi:hypothetical protein